VITLRSTIRSIIRLGSKLAISIAAALTTGAAAAAPPAADAEMARFFETSVRPVLVERCGSCHGAEKQKAGLRLDSLVGMLRGGESGPAIEPGDPTASNLVAAVRHESWEMPPDGKLPDDQIAAIERWIAAGAPWPGTRPAAELIAAGLPAAEQDVATDSGPRQRKQKGTITDADRSYWAYQPVQRPDLPPLPSGEGVPDSLLRSAVHNPIDRFILAQLERAGIEPVAEADRATLIRRLSYDLLGVPPEPADVASFIADPAADAYEQLVDRLLADPRHGGRWARHWLDLARYAESDGFRQDAFRPTAWRYRDYVVDSFNADKPFDRFILEQLAGDELFPHDVAAITATGFLRQTPYEYNQVDVERQRSEILNEVTDVTADVFLAMGMGCARCHDHKFDPLLQRDYFSMQSFFAPLVWRDNGDSSSAGRSAAYTEAQRAFIERTAELRSQLAAIEQDTTDEAAWKGLERFPPEIKALFFKPASGRYTRSSSCSWPAGR
jgi:cytochrome c553